MLGPRFEKYYPVFFATLVAASVFYVIRWLPQDKLLLSGFISKLFMPALNVSAIAIGFLATSQSILISLKDSPGIEQMKIDGYHEPFVNFLSKATGFSFCLAVLSGIFSAMDFGKLDRLHGYLEVIWMFVCVLTLLAYYRAVSLLPYVLRGAVPRCAKKGPPLIPFDPNRR